MSEQRDFAPARFSSGEPIYGRAVRRDEIAVRALNRIAAIKEQHTWSDVDAEEAAEIAFDALQEMASVGGGGQ